MSRSTVALYLPFFVKLSFILSSAMIDLCQWRARIGFWNCFHHWSQSSDCTRSSTGSIYCGTTNGAGRANVKTFKLILSIFCLAILLFISGDVELNPGPTLTGIYILDLDLHFITLLLCTDKPKRDELVELLSSSKFTAGTWEQFVCCLPKMTQDIIAGIKEGVSKEENTISAIAQHCFDNNPDITWRNVIDALLDANEVTVARNVLDKHSGSYNRILHMMISSYILGTSRFSSSKNVYNTVMKVLRSHYSKLTASTQTCLTNIAIELYSKNLINREVKNSPTFEKIEIDFSAMVSIYTEDTEKMIEVCSLFLDCLSIEEGPAKEEAIALARDWENELFRDHQVSFFLTKAATSSTTFISKEVELGFNDKLAIELRNLHKKYAKLMTDITTYYASSRKHDPIVLARWVQNTFDETGLAQDGVTVDKIFEQMQSYYSFIDIEAVIGLIEAYPIDDDSLQARLDEYTDNINKFIDSTELNDIVKTIEAAIIGETIKVDPKIILKLSGKWNHQTIGHVHKLMKYFFDEEAKYITIKKFLRGSICIQFLVFSKRSVQTLIVKSQAKFAFMHLLGIFQLIIDDQTIIDKEEDVGFTFEESLLQSIASIESNPEYHRLSLLLIELKMKINYQNTNGQTALMLASVDGHIEIFQSLLQNCADPFVKLPANREFIGLNSLACIALSQHIYKSIGGEKIIPQDDTSVEDILEMAVNKREVSSYQSFKYVIENNLKKRFQCLQNCFHALNSHFLDATTKILTSKAWVTEVNQNFQSYIKEDAACENAHQLVQLLQPHYSCLNITLLTVPCTITEPIKEQVENYNTNLNMFKDTTSLLELAMMTKGMLCSNDFGCSKFILRLKKSWCSKTITELDIMGNFYLSPFLTLQEIHYDASSMTCTYLIPQLQTETLMKAVIEQRGSLNKSGVFEVIINDIPLTMEDKDNLSLMEAVMQKLLSYNSTALLFACERGDFSTVQLLLSRNLDEGSTGLMMLATYIAALMTASRYGHHQIVELLLSKVPDIDIQDNNGRTALIRASCHGHHKVVELILNEAPDIDIQDNNGCTALLLASHHGHHQVVELILNKILNINIQNRDGWTALMSAIYNGHHQVVELLLNKNPDINIQDNDGWTALKFASRYGHHQVVELLLNKDPDINIQDNDGWTALKFASRYGHHQVVELLLNKDPDINIQDNDGWTALISASCYGHHQVVELLLNKDPDINIQDNDGWTALMSAIYNGHSHVVKLLLNKDPDINIQDNDGWTALKFASRYGHHQVVELLLNKDPDINIQDNDGWTALISASCYGHHQVVELLLNKDPDINIQDNDGWTALMLASRNGYHQVVELLLSKDPDINIQNNNSDSAFTITMVSSYFIITEVFDITPDRRIQLLNQLHSGNYIKILQLLLNCHHINHTDGRNLHSLAVAAKFNNFDAVTILIEKCSITPEHIIRAFTAACYEGHSSMIIHLSEKITILSNNERKLLVAAAEGDLGILIDILCFIGMSPNTALVAGITSLMIAASCGHIELVDVLIQVGADVNKRNDEGLNALDIVNDISFYDRANIKQLLIPNSPAGKLDQVSNNAKSNDKKTSIGDTIKSNFGKYIKEFYDPYYAKQKELKIVPSEAIDQYKKFSTYIFD